MQGSGFALEGSNSETGTGGAYAPLSEILPAARVARFVRMTDEPHGARFGHDDKHALSFRSDDKGSAQLR
jgi:hypothetical protein